MKQYAVVIPGWAHSLTVYAYNEPDARRLFRAREGFGKRLPSGTRVYLINNA